MDKKQYLAHYGMLGMKWGIRKEKEIDYRSKMTSISNNQKAPQSDLRLAQYRKQPLSVRLAKTAASVVVPMVLTEVVSGNTQRYSQMSKDQLTKHLVKKATSAVAITAANLAVNDALAKSMSKRYDNSGTQKPGQKHSEFTKEDKIKMGIKAAQIAAVPLYIFTNIKMSQIVRDRVQNKARFDAWGSNILSSKVDQVIWQSEDLKTAIVDKRR